MLDHATNDFTRYSPATALDIFHVAQIIDNRLITVIAGTTFHPFYCDCIWKIPGTVDFQPVRIKPKADIRPADCIISVGNGVNDGFTQNLRRISIFGNASCALNLFF